MFPYNRRIDWFFHFLLVNFCLAMIPIMGKLLFYSKVCELLGVQLTMLVFLGFIVLWLGLGFACASRLDELN